MTDAKPLLGLRQLPLRTKAVVGALVACGLVVLGTTLFIVIQILRIQVDRVEEVVSPEVHEAAPPPAHVPHPVAPFAATYELQGMSISLGNRNQTLVAYAEFKLTLDCPTQEAKKWMELNRASLRDAVYEATLNLTVEEFSTSQGFVVMKQRILDTLKGRFGEHAPRDVAISDWTIR